MRAAFTISSCAFSVIVFAACQSADRTQVPEPMAPDSTVRRPASVYDDPGHEQEFRQLFSQSDSTVKLRTNYFERLLRIQYRAELHVEEFEKHLDEIIEKQRRDPSYSPDPLDDNAYRKLRLMWMLAERTTHELSYFYQRMHEVSHDQSAKVEDRAKAVRTLEDTHRWLDSRPEEDKLELIELFERLGEIKKQEDQANRSGTDHYRGTASSFGDFAFMAPHETEARFKARAPQIRKKARQIANARDAELDAAISGFAPEAERKPDSAKIFPSAGPQGNTLGREFPSGTFTLTYDDGPGGKSTQRLQGVLKSHADAVNTKGAPASFFWLAKNVVRLPQVVAAIKAGGFPMNNHSWNHPLFSKLGQNDLRHEILESTATLTKAYGYRPKFFRCPYGACYAPAIPAARQLIAEGKMIHAYWQIDSLDWKNIGQPQRTADIIIKQMQASKKGVILMHDIHESTVDATQIVLSWIKAQNGRGARYRLKTLEEAVDDVNQGR